MVNILISLSPSLSFNYKIGFGTTNTLFSGTNTMNNSQSLFGGTKFGTTQSNLFSSGTTTGLTGFPSVSNVTGTTIKFNPLLSTDIMIKNGANQNINTRHQCITCMKEYENKSLEELRFEDYQANRKGSSTSTMFGTTTNQPQTSLFGSNPSSVSFNTANTASSSLFNNATAKPTFGAPATTTATTSIFNSTFNKSFNTNAFGSTAQQPTQTSSIFGPSASNTGGFGQQPTNNLFNMTSQNNATAANQVKPSFFTTATTQPNSLFGNTATNTTLGAAKPMFGTGTSGFGVPASSSFNFNTSTQPATTSSSLFSNNQGTTSLFNTGTASTQPKSMFNFPTQTTGLGTQNTLNTTGQQTSSLFGNTGLGTTNNLGTTGTTSLFGNMGNTGTGSLFGNTTSNTGLLGSSAQNQGTMLSLQQISSPSNQQNNDLLMNRLQSLPYGSSSLFQNKVGSSPNSNSLKFTTDPKVLNKYKVSFSSNNNSTSNQVQRVPTSSIKNTSLLFDGLDDDNPDDKKTAFNIFVPRKNIKKLTIKPKENLNASALNSSTNEEISSLQNNNNKQQSVPSLKLQLTGSTVQKKPTNETTVNADNTVLEYFRPQQSKAYSSTPAISNNQNNNNLNVAASSSSGSPNTIQIQSPAQSVILADRSNSANKAIHHHHIVINSPETSVTSLNDSQNYSILGHDSGDACPSPVSNLTYSIPRCKVILTRTEYFTIPPLEQLDVEDETCVVESFTVGRHGYGSIFWEGPLDIYGLNLDEIVHIRRKEVIVYPDDENKPEEGFGLNRPAQITLHKVWPVDKTTHELIKDPQRLIKMNYSEKIEHATIKFGGIFKEYRPDTGSWVFKVKHFSKYGLVEDEEDEENQMHTDHRQQQLIQAKSLHHFASFNGSADHQQHLHFFNRPVQQAPTNDRLFLNLDEDETSTEGLDEEDEEILDDFIYPDELPVANTYNHLLRNVLFENEDKVNIDLGYEKSAKKAKMLLKSDVISDDYFDKQAASFSFVQPQYTQKLDLVLKPDAYPAKNKIYYDISSIKCSLVPKVRFSNSLNNLLVIDGRNVNVCKLQLIPELNTGNLNERFNLQMNCNSDICLPSNDKAPFIQVKPTIENKYNIDRLEKLVKALYGSLDIETEHEYNQERLNRIIDWLAEQNRKQSRSTNLYDRIIYYLASNEIKQAVDDLIASDHPKLAILLSSGNNFAIKNNICQQLLEWKTLQGDTFISSDLLKIYVLLSGETRYRLSNNHQIDVLENLTWTQQLALLLLYSVENDLVTCIKNMTCRTDDVEYHLIANHSPLVAMSSAENDLEAWFLHQSLKSYGIIRPEINSNVQHGLLASELINGTSNSGKLIVHYSIVHSII